MTPTQFVAAMIKLGCTTQVEIAKVLGIGRQSAIRYVSGTTAVPVSVQRLIKLLQQHGVPEEWRA